MPAHMQLCYSNKQRLFIGTIILLSGFLRFIHINKNFFEGVKSMAELFTMNSSLKEILENERINKKLNYIFSELYYRDIKPVFRKMKLKNMVKFVKTPWGSRFPAEGLVLCANFLLERRQKGELISIPIWKDLSEDKMLALQRVVLIPFMDRSRSKAPCIILCPGGSYNRVVFHHEGIPVASRLCEMGYQVFVLNYTVAPGTYPKAQQDLVRAIRFVRKNYEKLGIDTEDVMLMGFSAGGHLCATVAAMYDRYEDETHRYDEISAKPDKLCLGYPLVSLVQDPNESCIRNLLGEQADEEEKRALSAELILSKDYPKTFIWACEDDAVIPVSHAKRMAEALNHKKVPHMLELYPTGGHAIGLGEGTCAEGWLEKAAAYLSSDKSA